MTPNDALLLTAGFELDRWLAINIMRWYQDKQGNWWCDGHFCDVFTPKFSRSAEEAFDLESKLFERGWLLTLERYSDNWGARFCRYFRTPEYIEQEMDEQTAPTPALAICRAAVEVIRFEAKP